MGVTAYGNLFAEVNGSKSFMCFLYVHKKICYVNGQICKEEQIMLKKVESSSKNVPQVDSLKAFTDKIYYQDQTSRANTYFQCPSFTRLHF